MSMKNRKTGKGGGHIEGEIDIDPSIVRFTHSRIRPFFTGCGFRIEDTLRDIVEGRTSIEDIPLITVIANRDGDDTFYFSLNNRRLYLIKRLQSLGLIDKVRVRIKSALPREVERYTPDRCSLEATIMGDNEVDLTADDQDKPKSGNSGLESIDSKLLKSLMPELEKLQKKNKPRELLSLIDEYCDDYKWSDGQRKFLCDKLGISNY